MHLVELVANRSKLQPLYGQLQQVVESRDAIASFQILGTEVESQQLTTQANVMLIQQ